MLKSKAVKRIVLALALCVVLAVSSWGGWVIVRHSGLSALRDITLQQSGREAAQDAPCAQGVRRDTLMVNFPMQIYAGAPDNLLGRDSVDVVPMGVSASVFFSNTLGSSGTITAVVLPDLILHNASFVPLGAALTLDSMQPLLRKAGQVIVNASGTDVDMRFAGCLSAENQSPPAVFRAIIGDRLLLTGWRLAVAGDSGAGMLTLTLNWHVQAPDIDDVGVLVQVLDASGSLVTETRGYPLAGTAPSRFWRLGDQWRDVREVRISNNAVVKGDCRILVGLYTTTDGERLHAYDLAGKRLPGDMVTINFPTQPCEGCPHETPSTQCPSQGC